MKKWVNGFCLLCILFFLGLYFKPETVFNRTIIAGGDTPSHYGLAHYITENDIFFGWTPGNFSGSPTFQFYPPIPFVLIVLAEKIVSLQLAFKLVYILGIFLLPAASFYCLHKMKFSFPTPILGAIFSLIFLFNEGNSMWGANIPSTLAGEFSYSLGYAFSVAYLGLLFRSVKEGKGIKLMALLLSVIGLTHGYPFVFIIMVSSFFLLISSNTKKTLVYFAKMYVLAFLLMGFWLIPALLSLSFTIPFNFIWRFESLKEFLPPLFFPLIAIILMTNVYLLWTKRMQMRIVYFWYAVSMAMIGYLLGFFLGLVDIRFLPFAQGMFVLLAAIGIGESLRNFKAKALIPVAAIILTCVTISLQAKFIEPWIDYNFSGFENKPLWEEFSKVNSYLKGNEGDPRVVYEHSAKHEGAGTVRAFEMLPLFSGRSTLEGLYMQSSINSPFAYYIQSEISQVGSHPLMYYNYPRFDLSRAVRHLDLFNVSQFVTITEATQQAASLHPDFELEKQILPYSVFQLKDNDGHYVVPLQFRPIFVRTQSWKRLFFDWFRLTDNTVFLVSSGKSNLPDEYSLYPSSPLDLSNLPADPLPQDVRVTSTVRPQEILIETSMPGHPLLVKVSYHPNWHVQGACAVYLASPGFMIVFPESPQVRLYYKPGLANRAGWLSSLLGLLVLGLSLPLLFKKRDKRNENKKNNGLSLGYKTRWLIFGVILVGLTALSLHFHYDAHTLYQKGLKHFHKQEYDKAQKFFSKGIHKFPFSPAVDGSHLYYGLSYYKKENWEEAILVWNNFMKKYPEGRYTDEMLYHIGLSYRSLRRDKEATAVFDELKTKFPDSRFSNLVQ